MAEPVRQPTFHSAWFSKRAKFSFRNLRSLKTLDLSKNSLSSIGDETFFTLEKLEYLHLQENQLNFGNDSRIRWESLERIKRLDLSKNQIKIST